MGYGVIKLNNRRRRKIKQQREISQKKNYDKLCMYIVNHGQIILMMMIKINFYLFIYLYLKKNVIHIRCT